METEIGVCGHIADAVHNVPDLAGNGPAIAAFVHGLEDDLIKRYRLYRGISLTTCPACAREYVRCGVLLQVQVTAAYVGLS